jgi:hypothetical protein
VAIIGATSHATLVHKRRKLGVSDFALFCFLVPVTDDNLKLENQKNTEKTSFPVCFRRSIQNFDSQPSQLMATDHLRGNEQVGNSDLSLGAWLGSGTGTRRQQSEIPTWLLRDW